MGKSSNWLWRRIWCGLRLALTGLRDLFFVRECAVCGEELESEHGGVRQTVRIPFTHLLKKEDTLYGK